MISSAHRTVTCPLVKYVWKGFMKMSFQFLLLKQQVDEISYHDLEE